MAAGQSRGSRESREVETSALDRPTLERFYRTVLERSIPGPELMTLDQVCRAYLGDSAQPGVVVLAEGEPVAGLLGEVYPDSGVLLVAYLAVRDSLRGRGIGAALWEKTLARWSASLRPSLILGEIEDPRFHAANADKGDPLARVRFYHRVGTRLLAMPYFQPSLRPGSPRVYDMLLICYGGGDAASSETVAAFLKEYFELCEGRQSLTDPEFLRLLNYVGHTGRVPLWPLDRYTDVTRFAIPTGRD